MHPYVHEYLQAKKNFHDARLLLQEKEHLMMNMLISIEKQQVDVSLSNQELDVYGLTLPITNVKITSKKTYNSVTLKYITTSLHDFIILNNFPGTIEDKENFATNAANHMWKNRGGKSTSKVTTTKVKISQKRCLHES